MPYFAEGSLHLFALLLLRITCTAFMPSNIISTISTAPIIISTTVIIPFAALLCSCLFRIYRCTLFFPLLVIFAAISLIAVIFLLFLLLVKAGQVFLFYQVYWLFGFLYRFIVQVEWFLSSLIHLNDLLCTRSRDCLQIYRHTLVSTIRNHFRQNISLEIIVGRICSFQLNIARRQLAE